MTQEDYTPTEQEPSSGKSIWWAKDATWYDRERVVDLTLRHGAIGSGVLDWLSCHAKQINDGGWVKSGYKSVSRALGELDRQDEVAAAIRYAGEIGALDEFVEQGYGMFTCRVSGWRSDQERFTSAERQRRYRERLRMEAESGETLVTVTPVTVTQRDERRNGSSPTVQDKTGQDTTSKEEKQYSNDIIEMCGLLASEMKRNLESARVSPQSKAWREDMRKIIELDGHPATVVRDVILYCQSHDFWKANIESPGKLRKHFNRFLLEMQADQPKRGPAQGDRGMPFGLGA